ncbi:hypothetical protein JST97_29900 [bacterium]|nr:hypothetical protein [bacterium]
MSRALDDSPNSRTAASKAPEVCFLTRLTSASKPVSTIAMVALSAISS